MALNTFGWTPADVITDQYGNGKAVNGLTVWTDWDRTTQVTDIYDMAGTLVGTVSSLANGRYGFKAPDAYDRLYVWDGVPGSDPYVVAAHEALDAGQTTHAQAVAAAQAAQQSAADAAGLVGAPADTAMAAALGNPASQSRTVLSSTYDPRMPGLLSSRNPLGAVKSALDNGMSTCVQTFSDSTGVTVIGTQKRWPYLLGESIAAKYPALTVQHRQWNDTNQNFDAVQTIQTGNAGARGIDFGTQGAYLPGSAIAPATADLDVRVKVAFDAWPLAGNGVLVCHGYTAGNYSFRFLVNNAGQVMLRWSRDGSTNEFSGAFNVTGVTVGTPLWLRFTYKADNGAAQHVQTFYQSTDGTNWTQIGVGQPGGVGAMFASTQDWELGAEGYNASMLNGKIYEVQILDGIGGTNIAPLQIDDWNLRAESTSSRIGSPVLLINNGAKSGADILYLSDSTRLPKMVAKTSISACILSDSHNDGTKRGADILSLWDTWLTRLRSALPVEAHIVVTTQNPETSAALSSGANPTAHGTRQWQVAGWARKNGLGIVDAYRAFKDDPRGLAALLNADGLHPSDAAGSPLWRDQILRAAGF